MRSLLLTLANAWLVQAISLWDPTGPYHVGYTQHIFNHTTPNDPTSPGTFFLLTIYYPTLQIPNTTIPYLDPISAGIFESTIGLTPGSLSRLTTRLQFQASTLLGTSPAFANATSPYPTLIFTPGAGVPAAAYTAYLSELASHGHAVVAIDHPGEAPYLPLPYGGGGVYGYPDFSAYPPTMEEAFQVLDFRVSDILAAVSEPFLPDLVRAFGAPFNVTHFGVFGHSVGGAAAAAVMAATGSSEAALFKVGANLDGSLLQFSDTEGNVDTGVAPPDLERPFLELAGHTHFEGNLSIADGDGTWEYFSEAQSGWLRVVQVNGTRHLDYSDIPLWIDLLEQRAVLNRTWVGPADGVRVTQLTNALLRELFGYVEGKSLDGVDEWVGKAPEFFLLDENDP
ncbi:hypothetical protein B0J12DRAFT_643166 [Macrophomina phaseolina]|uniref:1-alkyl-2-acetylglycerophosphocholine esterase n=1 Tax=Macrophomina phaseolina TaxID=35725 RepID=A0ABQ8GVW3_9PEZI|nr:hypothetical protein B0J12DRAFT_643166 [Macrophomina phaseolina]